MTGSHQGQWREKGTCPQQPLPSHRVTSADHHLLQGSREVWPGGSKVSGGSLGHRGDSAQTPLLQSREVSSKQMSTSPQEPEVGAQGTWL